MNPIELLKFIITNFIVNTLRLFLVPIYKKYYACILKKKERPPEKFNSFELLSKDFMYEITIPDYLRDEYLYLQIKRNSLDKKKEQIKLLKEIGLYQLREPTLLKNLRHF
jgi:hypothetical protein